MLYLAILDFIWAIAAWTVDYSKLSTIPAWAWVFTLVCPIYPFLLALVWLKLRKSEKVNQYLLSFAVLPTVVFGVLAILYYPIKMSYSGFNIRDFGQIFWVIFYSSQGWYLLRNKKITTIPILGAVIFLSAKFILDYRYMGFGYFNLNNIPNSVILGLIIIAIASSYVVALIALKKR